MGLSAASGRPERIGRYAVVEELRRGSFGVVYRARDPEANRPVAIRLMTAPIARDAQRVARFEHEARVMTAFEHRNVAAVYESGLHEGWPFAVVEWLGGSRDLAQCVKATPGLSVERKLDLVAQAAAGLHYAHERGLVHGDVKPANLRLLGDGTLKVVDFGLPRVRPLDATNTAEALGSLPYASPERARGDELDARSDVYSLGAVLYELLAGTPPFTGAPEDVVADVLSRAPARPKCLAGTPWAGLEPLLLRCLAKPPAERYASAAALADALLAHARPIGSGVSVLYAADLVPTGGLAPDTTDTAGRRSPGSEPRFAPGTLLGERFRIVAPLGRGGMGEVYLADDLRLGHPVALKFLHAAADSARRERLHAEVRLGRQVSHPHVCRIYDVGEAQGHHFLAMEYVDGEDLASLLRRIGRLPEEKALELAREVSEGLAAAHDLGIVHRDLKPANVMIDARGAARITDFGLAGLLDDPPDEGGIAGTPSYMSPEQLSGAAATFASDVYALGLVLYDAFTGRRLFPTAATTQSIAARRQPPPPETWRHLRGLPTALQASIRRCLHEDAAARPSAREVLAGLAAIEFKTAGDGRPDRRRTLALAGVLSIVALGAAWLSLGRSRPEKPAPPLKLTKLTSDPGLEDEPALSPDGRFVAYTTDARGNLDVVVVPTNGSRPVNVLASEADEAEPAWSPDGRWLAYVSAAERGGRLSVPLGIGSMQVFLHGQGGDLFMVPALGGTPLKLVDNGYSPAWSPDGRSIAFCSNRDERWDIWVVSVDGGAPTRLTNDAGVDFHPSWSPDGRYVAYATFAGLRVVPAAGGTPRHLTEGDATLKPAWSPDGRRVLFSSDRSGAFNVWSVAFSGGEGAPSNAPTRVTLGEGNDVVGGVARDGRLAFATVKNAPDIWELTLATRQLRQVALATSREDWPQVSPDGRTLLVLSDRGGRVGLWTMDLAGRFLSQVNPEAGGGVQPSWSPDGKQVAYVVGGDFEPRVVVQRVGDVSVREIVRDAMLPVFSPDGGSLAFVETRQARYRDVHVYRFRDGTTRRLTRLESEDAYPTWSPDGRQIAFQAELAGRRELWSVPSEGGEPRQVTAGDGEKSHPKWSPVDADEVLFLLDHKNACVVSAGTGRVRQITHFVEANVTMDYPSWSPDGARVYFSLSKKTGDVHVLDGYQ